MAKKTEQRRAKTSKASSKCPHTFVVTDRNGEERRYDAFDVKEDLGYLFMTDSEDALVAIIRAEGWNSVHRVQ